MMHQPKKPHTPPILALCLLMGGLLVACNSEQPEFTAKSDIIVRVQTVDYQHTTTKTADSGYVTHFSNGDQIGIFVKSANGAYTQNNVPYHYDGTSDTWQPDAEQIRVEQGAVCLAYYPYSATITTWGNLQNYVPRPDQFFYDDYTASDLMMSVETTPTGSNAQTLNFVLTHRMALLIFQPLTSVSDMRITVSFGAMSGRPYMVDRSQSLSRYLIKPGRNQDFSGIVMQTGREPSYWQTRINTEAGKYYIINILN